jgi:hypothetical protein
MDQTKIKISKLEAVRRQLETAIRIYFVNGDPVSIHTLAAASLQILSDLDRRGGGEGTLLDLVLSGIKPEYVKEVRKLLAEAENFFKHADRDPDRVLEFAISMPEFFLWACACKYPELVSETPPLMLVFRVWFIIHHPDILKREIRAQVDRLNLSADFTSADRGKFLALFLPIAAKNVMSQLRGK